MKEYMAEIPAYVTDASAAAKWLFQEEPDAQQAVDLLSDYLRGRANLFGPPHLPVEILSIVRGRVISREISSQLGERYIRTYVALRIPTIHPDGLIPLAYEYSMRYSISAYDAVYVALAQIEQAPLVTADTRLLTALGNRFPFILPLEDYPTR